MYMTIVFAVFAALACAAGLLMPHVAHHLAFLMMLIYLGFAVMAALINLLRPRRR